MQNPTTSDFPESSTLNLDQTPPTVETPTEQQYPRVRRFKFHGNAMEYFGIWIVNILLTIVTLSLYAPWAKVRRLRYFYGNTEFFRRRFDFTGIPTKILIGRLIALGIYAAFSVSSQYSMTATVVGFVLLYMAVPWLIRATMRFTARNSKFGNSRFYFGGTTKESYKVFFLSIAVYIFSLGIFSPVAIWLYKKYYINHLYAGQLEFKLHADWSAYMSAVYVPIFMSFGVMIAFGIVYFSIVGAIAGFSPHMVMIGVFAIYAIAGLFIYPLSAARIFITTWNNTTVGHSQFKTDCNQWRYAWIIASNWVVKIFTIGLMSAWAAIRLHKYQVESMSLILHDDPDQMINLAQQEQSALAEEISDIFDIDISL